MAILPEDLTGLCVSIAYTEEDGESHNCHGIIKSTSSIAIRVNVLYRNGHRTNEDKIIQVNTLRDIKILLPPSEETENNSLSSHYRSVGYLPLDENLDLEVEIEQMDPNELFGRSDIPERLVDNCHFEPIQPVRSAYPFARYYFDNNGGFRRRPGWRNKKQNKKLRKQNEACFGGNVSEFLDTEFDFESNLALFDKKSVFAEIDQQQGKTSTQYEDREDYEYQNGSHSEPAKSLEENLVSVTHYVNANGQEFRALTSKDICSIRQTAAAYGLSFGRQTEMLANSMADLANRFLESSNRSRQESTSILVVCGSSVTGNAGIATARHLAWKIGDVTVMVKKSHFCHPLLAKEFALYNLMGHSYVQDCEDTDIDGYNLIILAMEQDCEIEEAVLDKIRLIENCPVGALNPPSVGFSGIQLKFSLLPAWPVSQTEANGDIFVANVGIPPPFYREAGIEYMNLFEESDVVELFRLIK